MARTPDVGYSLHVPPCTGSSCVLYECGELAGNLPRARLVCVNRHTYWSGVQSDLQHGTPCPACSSALWWMGPDKEPWWDEFCPDCRGYYSTDLACACGKFAP